MNRKQQNWHELAPLFLGAYAENNDLLEKLLREHINEHVFWRRNFHPDDQPPIATTTQYTEAYLQTEARTRQALHELAARLKRTVPFFHPRYVGHMASDVLLPGLVAKIVTTLYNPNNVCTESASVTIDMELEAGQNFARMLGFNVDPDSYPVAWGHLTSGGTVANIEALWNIRHARFLGLAMAKVGGQRDLVFTLPDGRSLTELNDWELFNLPLDQVLWLWHQWMSEDPETRHDKTEWLAEHLPEHLGLAAFFQRYWTIKPPMILVPATAHYSWKKAAKILGLGAKHLVEVPVDRHMRMDASALSRICQQACAMQTPILAVVGVLGTTEFGTIDPIDQIVEVQQSCQAQGLYFPIHVDAAWGGYLASMIRSADGGTEAREHVRQAFTNFPSPEVYDALVALKHADSVTLDPHKLGYLPYAVGGVIYRNRLLSLIQSQKADYVFSGDAAEGFANLGQFILEGSKSGASAAAVWVSQKVMPLHAEGMGKLVARSIHNAEYFIERVNSLKKSLEQRAAVVVPVMPDSNLVTLAINPSGNHSAAQMNQFMTALLERLAYTRNQPVQNLQFIGSSTRLYRKNLSNSEATRLCMALGLSRETFVTEVKDKQVMSDSLLILRHTLMSPWLIENDVRVNYIDLYFDYLEQQINVLLAEWSRYGNAATA